MKIETTAKLTYPALVLRGEFDTDSVEQFIAAADQVRESGGKQLMVSLRYVKYLNSTALGAIVRTRATFHQAGGDLIILQPSRLSRDILTKMGLDTVLRIFDDEQSAASHFAGVTVPGEQAASAGSADNDETRVMFSFDDERAELVPGKSHHGVATLDAIDSSSLTFRWNPEAHGSDAATCAAMFTPGSTMRNKLQLKLIRKGFFEADSAVESLSTNSAGDAVVVARWSRISDTDRADLDRYKQDLEFLKQQADESTAAES